ncbi:MAG: DUF5372 family protein [Acidiferrobacteraceae bacterium]
MERKEAGHAHDDGTEYFVTDVKVVMREAAALVRQDAVVGVRSGILRHADAEGAARAPCSCNSTKNVQASIAATRLVRVTHPFHPLNGRQLPCVGERYNRYGMTLPLETDEGSVCSVPPQWTDVVAPDSEIILGGQRALFRVADLLELVRLVDRLSGHDLPEGHR